MNPLTMLSCLMAALFVAWILVGILEYLDQEAEKLQLPQDLKDL